MQVNLIYSSLAYHKAVLLYRMCPAENERKKKEKKNWGRMVKKTGTIYQSSLWIPQQGFWRHRVELTNSLAVYRRAKGLAKLIVSLYHYQNYWNFDHECKRSKHKIGFRDRKVIGTFEKRAPGLIILDCQVSAVRGFPESQITRSFSQLIFVLANKWQDVLDKFSHRFQSVLLLTPRRKV